MPSIVADDVEDAFRAALEKDAGIDAAGAAPDLPPPPPRKSVIADPDAPHGRDEHGEPLAPFGVNRKTGRPNLRKPGPGRAPKDEQPRVQPLPPEGAKPRTKRDYSAQIGDLVDGVWMLLSSAPVPLPAVRIRVHAQAALLHGNKPGIVGGINIAAQNNETVARGVEKLTTGNVSWMLPAMFALTPFVAQSVMMWRSPAEGTTEALAAQNQEAWDETVRSMAAQFAPAEDDLQEAA